MLYLFITDINANIQFARQEGKGEPQYQRPLEESARSPAAACLLALAEQALAGQGRHSEEQDGAAESRRRSTRPFDAVSKRWTRGSARILQFTDEGLAKQQAHEHYRPAQTVRATNGGKR